MSGTGPLRYAASYRENIDTTTPTGELIFHVIAPLTHAEQGTIAQLLSEGISMNRVNMPRDVV